MNNMKTSIYVPGKIIPYVKGSRTSRWMYPNCVMKEVKDGRQLVDYLHVSYEKPIEIKDDNLLTIIAKLDCFDSFINARSTRLSVFYVFNWRSACFGYIAMDTFSYE